MAVSGRPFGMATEAREALRRGDLHCRSESAIQLGLDPSHVTSRQITALSQVDKLKRLAARQNGVGQARKCGNTDG
jgi:hypothetical protein